MTLGGREFSARYDHLGYARFLTFSCINRQPLFFDAVSRDCFADRMAIAASRLNITVFAWVLMPEHAHLCVASREVGGTRGFVLQLKSSTARTILKAWREAGDPRLAHCTRNGRSVFWQEGGGYDRTLRDEREIDEKIRYIHHNPVKRGLVSRPTDWRWSSAGWIAGDRSSVVRIESVPR
jgi:putative transposase